MIWVAFLLGFMGSLHCIGMCGPIAIPLAQLNRGNMTSDIIFALKYNSGRVITYAFMGLVFGMISKIIDLSGIQSSLSILAGATLILLFLLSLDIEKVMFRWKAFTKYYSWVQSKITSTISGGASKYPLFVGIVNGILPCGLVYLALTGALTSGSPLSGMTFMAFFGLGTFPAMIGIMISSSLIGNKYRGYFRKIYPFMHLAFGILLIFRGIGGDCAH